MKQGDSIGLAGIMQEPCSDLDKNFERLTRERDEAVQQQRATADVLKVMSRSAFELRRVLETLLASAAQLCDVDNAQIFLCHDGTYRLAACAGFSPEYETFFREHPIAPGRDSLVGRTALEGRVIHIPDILTDPEYKHPAAYRLGKYRTMLGIPLIRDGVPIGVLSLTHPVVKPFTERHIELVTTFADQAVIAIHTVRLFDQVQARSAELSELLAQQTATSEVLQVISRSAFDLQPVLDTLVENAVRLCGADRGFIFRQDGELYRVVASYGHSAAWIDLVRRNPIPRDRTSEAGRSILERRVVHIEDVLSDPEYTWARNQRHAEGMHRTILAVPMLKGEDVIGVIVIRRTKVVPFTGKQIDLLTTFADQAAIAIENVRLFEAEQHRSRELSETLQQQTATAEVLKVISRSTFDLQTVLDTLVQSATRLCDADHAWLFQRDGKSLRWAASYGHTAKIDARIKDYFQPLEVPLDRGSVTGRAASECRVVHVPDVLADPDYTWGQAQKIAGYRSAVGAPLLRQGDVMGVIFVGKTAVKPFTDKQIELITTFADQAVIAIENARLFDEVQARTTELARSVEELRALGAVSQTVNSTLDLQTVLNTIVAKATQISGTEAGVIYVFNDHKKEFELSAAFGMSEELIAAVRNMHAEISDAVGLLTQEGEPNQIADLCDLPSTPVNDTILRAGYRARLVVPLVRSERVIGALVVRRQAPGEFPANTVELLQTFATQSAIAIQNARLFAELGEKGRQLEEASRHKSQFLANMSHELRTPLNAILGYTELMRDNVYGEMPDKMSGVLERVERNGRHLLGLINDVLDLSKIEAGQLFLAIGEYSLKNVVHTVISTVEPLAKEKKLNLRIELPNNLPNAQGDERRLTQVLLNLVGNAIKFTDVGEVSIKGSSANGTFNVAVQDTGPGISEKDQAKLFQEFQQADNSITKKKGGTGLGLAISRRIIEMHGGRIWVESSPGQGSTFAFTLPVVVNEQARPA